MTYTLHHGDCLDILPTLPANSVDLIATDPPYYKVKGDSWDRQWDKPESFLSWLDDVLAELYRVLKHNGSLYLFASPKMAARVEVLIAQRFNVLNAITWFKSEQSYAEKYGPENFRKFVPMSERIIFAEHCGADNIAKGEAGYIAKCDELRGCVFEPLRAYLDGERQRAGVTVQDIAEAWRIKTGNTNRTGMAGHWFSNVQFALPTADNYQWLRQTLSGLNHGGEYLPRPYNELRQQYEDLRQQYEDLRQQYEDLRQQYEDLRRPFNVSADVPYTDVWTLKTVNAYPGKHPTEKPLPLMRHIIEASSRPGAVVLDCFMGSGTTGKAAQDLGREFIGIEKDAGYFAQAQRRIESVQPALMDAAD